MCRKHSPAFEELEAAYIRLLNEYPDLDNPNNGWISETAIGLLKIAKEILGYDDFNKLNNN